MSIVSESSPVTTFAEYDLFGLPVVQTTGESKIQTEHRPISILNSGGHIEFNIPTAINECIISNKIHLLVKLRVILNKTDKTDVLQMIGIMYLS